MQVIVGAKGSSTPCPVCRETVTKNSLHPDVRLRRKVAELRVRCHINPEKCSATGEFGQGDWWEKHERFCIANTELCVMCSERVLNTAMAAHLADFNELEVNCRARGKVQANAGPRHNGRLQVCCLGCDFKSKRSAVKDAQNHMKAQATKHLEMLLGEVQSEEEVHLMQYVLLTKQTHTSEKFRMTDGTQLEREGSLLSTKAETNRGWSRWLKAEPGTLLKVAGGQQLGTGR
eukprot:g41546.t1